MRWVTKDKRVEFLHRRIMGLGYSNGDNIVVDHINGVKTDERRVNLRVVSRAFNVLNQAAVNNRGSSKYRGVSWDKENRRWNVNVTVQGVKTYLGSFHDEDIAGDTAQAYRQKHSIPEY